MWRPWSSILEALGRIRFRLFTIRRRLRVGDPEAPDARGSYEWRSFLSPERLYDAWGPHPKGPWVPFHCVPLFAALDRIRRKEMGPTRPPNGNGGDPGPSPLPLQARPGAPAPRWLTQGTWTILDLPGPRSVEAAAWLITSAHCQPACTFDNWPNAKGVIRPEETLAEMLRWTTTVLPARKHLTPTAPPLWVCDSLRLGSRQPRPGDFDNRYYLDDSVLPAPALLRTAGIERVVYVTIGSADLPTMDLEAYFADLLAAGLPILHVDLARPDADPVPLAPPIKPRIVKPGTYRRSAAGGFGTDVPEPSSGTSG